MCTHFVYLIHVSALLFYVRSAVYVGNATHFAGQIWLLAKFDLQSAYRNVPVQYTNQHLLGLKWKDKALPFGLCSAPKIFTAMADALSWVLECEGVSNMTHYLDDFLFWSDADSLALAQALQVATDHCTSLGFLLAPDKTEGPTTRLTFLGIQFDTNEQ